MFSSSEAEITYPVNGNINYDNRKKENKTVLDLSIVEKAKKTGLDKHVLIDIEQYNDNVSLKDIKTYCEKLQISLVEILIQFFKTLL